MSARRHGFHRNSTGAGRDRMPDGRPDRRGSRVLPGERPGVRSLGKPLGSLGARSGPVPSPGSRLAEQTPPFGGAHALGPALARYPSGGRSGPTRAPRGREGWREGGGIRGGLSREIGNHQYSCGSASVVPDPVEPRGEAPRRRRGRLLPRKAPGVRSLMKEGGPGSCQPPYPTKIVKVPFWHQPRDLTPSGSTPML